jgi:hypothetical protein
MEQKELIILCLEDTNDWTNATTRRVVMQVRARAASPVPRASRCCTLQHASCVSRQSSACGGATSILTPVVV